MIPGMYPKIVKRTLIHCNDVSRGSQRQKKCASTYKVDVAASFKEDADGRYKDGKATAEISALE